MTNRLYTHYQDKVVPQLIKELELANSMQVPRIQKVVVNSGVGSIKDNKEHIENFLSDFAQIAGQQPVLKKAKVSVAGFKLRKGEPVGLTVTLRGDRMWAFLDKLINVALPRVRDFSGVSTKAFDKNGNYSLGVKEHTIFPEVNPNTVKNIRGMQATIVTSSRDIERNRALLAAIGLPFRKDNK